MKVVIDANVYASGLMNPSGVPAKLLRHLLSREHYRIVATKEILSELSRILYYPKIRTRIALSSEELEGWLSALELVVETLDIGSLAYLSPIVLDDPDDDIYILAAIASGAEYIISGDRHLLTLTPYNGIKIVTPAEFFTLLDSRDEEQ